MQRKYSSYIYIIFVISFWSSTAAVSKLLLKDLGNLQLLFFTCLFAAISLAIIVLLQGKFSVIKGYNLKDFLTFTFMGFIGVFLYTFCLFEALRDLTAQEAFILNYLWPIIVVILSSVILRENFTLKKFLGVMTSFFGVFIVLSKGDLLNLSFGSLRGASFAFIAAFSYGLFSVLGKRQDYDKYVSMMFYYLVASLFSLILVLSYSEIPGLSIIQLMGVLWLGVFTNGLAFVFWFLALKYGDTARMANIVFLTPFLSLVYTYFLVGEEILFSSFMGLIFILFGVLIQSIAS